MMFYMILKVLILFKVKCSSPFTFVPFALVNGWLISFMRWNQKFHTQVSIIYLLFIANVQNSKSTCSLSTMLTSVLGDASKKNSKEFLSRLFKQFLKITTFYYCFFYMFFQTLKCFVLWLIWAHCHQCRNKMHISR